MLIGVISDTHGQNNIINKLVNKLQNVDILIHLGDNTKDVEELKKIFKNKIISVRGNCDFRCDEPLELIEEIEGFKILVTHGHKYDVKYSLLKLKYRCKELGVNIALYGHTHISSIIFEDGIWFVNPGSASLPRDGYSSIAFITIENGNIKPEIQII